jgi:hypothetical protein
MIVIEIRPHPWGWKAFEAPGVEPVFLDQQDAIDYATGQEANKFSSAGVSRARRHQSLRPLNRGTMNWKQ